MIKILRTVKLDEAVGRVLFGNKRDILNPIISKIGEDVALLRINYYLYFAWDYKMSSLGNNWTVA